MKYFEYNLWAATSSEADSTRETALKAWKERARLYSEEYQKTREHLSKTFVKVYENNFGFRGCYLSDLLLSGNTRIENVGSYIKGITTCKILLSDLVDSWQITYSGIEFINYQPASENDLWAAPNRYRILEFSELLILDIDNNKLSHEFLLSNGSTLLLHFTRVSVKKINKP